MPVRGSREGVAFRQEIRQLPIGRRFAQLKWPIDIYPSIHTSITEMATRNLSLKGIVASVVLGLFFFSSFAICQQALFRVAPLVTDNMVLQQQSIVPFWARGRPGTTVSTRVGPDRRRQEGRTQSGWLYSSMSTTKTSLRASRRAMPFSRKKGSPKGRCKA